MAAGAFGRFVTSRICFTVYPAGTSNSEGLGALRVLLASRYVVSPALAPRSVNHFGWMTYRLRVMESLDALSV